MMRTALLASASVLAILSHAHAATTYYVSPSGSDSNPGTSSAPWKTINKADNAAASGDTVRVRPGSYSGAITTSKSGVQWLSDTLWGAKLSYWHSKGANVEINGFEIDGTNAPSGSNIGLELSGSGSIARKNHIHHISPNACSSNGTAALLLDGFNGGQKMLAEQNWVHDTNINANCGSWLHHGIYVGAPDSTVQNNLVVNVPWGFAFHVWHDGRRVKFLNNTSVNASGAFLFGGGDYYNQSSSGSGGNTAANNIIVGSGTGFNQSGNNDQPNTYTNNLEYNITNRATGTMQVSYIKNAVQANPLFVSASDYHLQGTSPAVGKGNPAYLPPVDYDGKNRSSPDIGAYAGGGTLPPNCYNIPTTWQNLPLTSPQTGKFTLGFDVTPGGAALDTAVGLSAAPSSNWESMATTVNFLTDGTLAARNAGEYRADRVISYKTSQKYHFRQVVDLPAKKYSVFVTGPDGNEQILATDYAFRTEQAGVTNLANVVTKTDIGPASQVCDIALSNVQQGPPVVMLHSSQLWYSAISATQCTGNGFNAPGLSGTVVINPGANKTYSLSCTGPGGTTTATVTTTASSP